MRGWLYDRAMLDRTNYRYPPSAPSAGPHAPLWAGIVILGCTYLAIGAVAFLVLGLGSAAVASSVLAVAMTIGIACSFTCRRDRS
jgi:hypothetical protein